MPGSVRFRITAAATLAVAVVLVVASIVVLRLVESDLLESTEATLESTLESYEAQFNNDFAARSAEGFGPAFGADIGTEFSAPIPPGFIELDNGTFVEPVLIADPFSTVYFVDGQVFEITVFESVVDSDTEAVGFLSQNDRVVAELIIDPFQGELIEVTPFEQLDELQLTILADLEDSLFEATELDDGRFIVAGDPLDEVRESLAAVRRALWILVPALTLLLGALTWLLVGRALRPVHEITDEVAGISASGLHRRVPVPAGSDEISDLANVMNGMLDRVESGVSRQRQFSADASHELRSPIASLRIAAELIERQPEHQRTAGLATDIVAEADRMDALIGDLLALARHDDQGTTQSHERVDLAEVVSAAQRAIPACEGIEVSTHIAAHTTIVGACSQLERAVRNLVENACRHASRRVAITVSTDHTVSVEDDGPGVPPDQRSRIFERFARADDARTRSVGGTGLGLALVQAIAERHGATVTVDDSPTLGGARFVLRFEH